MLCTLSVPKFFITILTDTTNNNAFSGTYHFFSRVYCTAVITILSCILDGGQRVRESISRFTESLSFPFMNISSHSFVHLL